MQTMTTLKQSFYNKNKIRCCLFLALTIADGLANLVISILLKEITDTAASRSPEQILRVCLRTAAALIVISVLSAALYYAKSSFLKHAVTGYKREIMNRILTTGGFWHVPENSGLYLSSLTNDIFVIETDYLQGLAEIISNLLFFAAALCIMIWYSPHLTAASICLMLLPIVISALSGQKLEREVQKVSDQNAAFVKRIQDILKGFSVIKSFHAEKMIEKIYAEENHSLEQAKYRKHITEGRINLWSALGSVSSQLGIFLIGAWLAAAGKGITAGTLIAFVSLLGQLANPISCLPGLIASRTAAGALIAKTEKLTLQKNPAPPDHSVRITGPIHTISLEHVSYSYGDCEALKNISLQFHQGKSYAIAGESGSGKTTLLHLIMAGRNDYSGLITYNGINAHAVDKESVINGISEIPQNVFLFDAAIRDNVTMFQEFPERRVTEAMKKAGLAELIRRKGSGYLCGEGGCRLSGGEKQRISIARCFLKEASVLIADEASAALDSETSFQIMNEILQMKDLTRIVVSHSMNQSLLKQYDQIIVMKNGRVQEVGGFEELMGRKGYFYSLYCIERGL